MHTFRTSVGYLSSLVMIGAVTTLVGCGSDGGTTDGNHASDGPSGSAGTASAGKGSGDARAGSSGSDSAGSSNGGPSNGGSSNGGSSSASGGSAGSDGAGTSNGGSTSGGTGGSAGADDGAGDAGADDGADDGLNEDYSISKFKHAEPTGPDHPLLKVESKLMRRDEVSLLGPGSGFGQVLDSAAEDYAILAGNTGASFVNDLRILDTAYANLDDDGNDELVAIGFVGTKLVVRVIDSDDTGVLNGVKEFAIDDANYKHAWIRVNDFDQDGRDEILVAAVSDSGVVARIYDDANANFALVEQVYQAAGQDLSIATGNFDKDRSPELALIASNGDDIALTVLDDAEHGFAPLKQLANAGTGLFRSPKGIRVHGVRIEAGNFDNDMTDEIIALADGYFIENENGGETSGNGIYTSSFDDAAHDFAPLKAVNHDYPRTLEQSGYRYNEVWPWQTLVADSNGDDVDELFLLANVQSMDSNDNPSRTWRLSHEAFAGDADTWDEPTDGVTVADVKSNAPATMTRAAGREDTRGADVIIAIHDDTVLQTYRAKAAIAGPEWVVAVSALGSPTTLMPAGKPVWATGGDFDGDGLRIRFTGEKWLELTRPRPLVLMSAPPTKAGIDQDYDATGTSYGEQHTDSLTTTNSVGYTDTVTVSLEVAVPFFDFISGSVTGEVSREFKETNTKTQSTSYGTADHGSNEQDVIIFNGTLCERYEYEIMGGKDTSLVGTKMTIDVPVDSRVYKWSVEAYNDALGPEGAPIPANLLHHTIGDPWSYRAPDQLPSNVLWTSKSIGVGNTSKGSRETNIELEKEETDGYSTTTKYELGGEGGAFLHVGYSHAWNEDSAYEVTSGKTTTYVGEVGDIAPADYTDWTYAFGMYVRIEKLETGEQLQVIDYFTEGLGKGYPVRED